MVNLMRFKIWYFVFSLLIILPGLYYLLTSGLRLGIDFTGGVLLEYKFEKNININELKQTFIQDGVEVGQISSAGSNIYIIRTKPLEQDKINKIKTDLNNNFGKVEERRVENVGPVIGKELSQKALIAIFLASLMIVLYIAYSFRRIPKPASSWRFGIAAVVALIHDVLVVVGAFAILGKFINVEVDTLFITALLTIIGFSVHDTIVVFDRIRENLLKNIGKKFIDVANLSVIQTLGRSLNTTLTVVFVLIALLLFGGETIKWFVVALLAGIISGTYSSIFNATALLVWWEEKLGH
ncbi:protein-export membrane protein SecF [Candidatus Daviesbacteria bacterium RIFCSPHIGHO2_02_FULL_39_12]|uniref:Protein-export membrane protein SecF n=2 Tax=Candidatus Daviesiibacteriota TaxID=1752718 RepID=A0A1F5JDI3_9BACT|nr:MAG: protein-export membrane protein SecF [Candidatus Daviesbacteria bacterium RIFCSPHIGHO2_02_FULL_39_12]OGE72647.1 MAG: protein-export membrane protein SecF [Candidatus Daviesbacteria bacterium RIFCSPLOWO2_02_FULL_38_15]